MSEETKEPMNQEEETPVEEVQEEVVEETPETQEESKEDAKGRKKSKKEKGITITREQAEQMELALKQLDSAKDQFLRLSAEYDNYRKRTTKEKESLYQDAKMDTIKAFLPVYDNLARAVETDADPDSPHRKGLEMIFQQYKDTLTKLGVTEMDALGQPFDPEMHNAVMHIENPELGENVIAQVFEKGFMLGDKVLRFAIVQVAN